MRKFRTLAAIFALLFFANLSWAQGTISFDSGYPNPNKPFQIQVAGTISPDCGWNIPCGAKVTVRVWQGGGEVLSNTFSISSGAFSGNFTGLQTAITYNVTVEVTLENGCDTATISSVPAVATTP